MCALVPIKGALDILQSRFVSFPHKTMFGKISPGREFWFEAGRKES